MAKSTNSSNLFSGFNPRKVEKKEETTFVTEKEPEKVVLSEEKVTIDTLVKEEVRKIVESQQLPSLPGKVGRPKKYEKDTKVISVRVDSDVYEFVKKKGKVEYDGITDYINHLIQIEMDKC